MTIYKILSINSFIILIFIISCGDEIEETTNQLIINNPQITISSDSDNNEISGLENIYINIKNFPSVWKVYVAIINNSSISIENRILIDTTSMIDQDIYQTTWDTKIFPNGNYELYVEILDSSNTRIATTDIFNIKNYRLATVINELASSVKYQIDSSEGIIFSNSKEYIKIENKFNDVMLSVGTFSVICGRNLDYSFTIKPDSINIPQFIKPDPNVFFLSAQNNNDDYLESITVKTNDNMEYCNNLSIPNDNQVYKLGYFSFKYEDYESDNIKIIYNVGDKTDSSVVSFFNNMVRSDTLIIN
tara:strand:- start:44 stop:952 length:909 start_codon:yes stop_codon:yes gene_type:complete